MRPIRLLHIFAACILASLSASAQSDRTLQFRIVDDADEPVAYAVVVAVNEQDSITSPPAFSSESGDVSLALNDASAYTALKVQCMGYIIATIPLPLASATVVLAKDPNMLGEVVVKAGPALQQKKGKFIFNPSELYGRSTDAYTVLRYTPLLTVGDSQISILGKGNSKIYINGRDPLMDAQGVLMMLKSLPPERIKKIEIITSPGASQEASMMGGIVNIIIDKPYEGYLGAIAGSLQYGSERFSPNLSFFNAYSVGNFRASAILFYKSLNAYEAKNTTYGYSESNRNVTNFTSNKSQSNVAGGGVNLAYEFTPSSILGVAFRFLGSKSHENSLVESDEIINEGMRTHTTTRINTVSPYLRPDYSVDASYNLKIGKIKGELDIKASFSSQRDPISTDYIFDNNMSSVQQNTDVKSRGLHIRPVYKQKIGSVHTLNVGYDILRSTIDNDYQYPGQDNRFKYEEMINSAFANWSASWSDAFYTSIGLRMENTDIDTRQTVGNETSSKNYTDFFPSLYASIDLPGGGNQSLSFSLSRNITRPYYNSLNPFIYWTSPTTYSMGNTELIPQYSWRYGVNYSFLRYFIMSLSYSHKSNSMHDYVFMDDAGNTVSSTGNFGNSNLYSASLSFNKALTKIWYIKSYISAYHISEEATIGHNDIGYSNTFFSFGAINNITLSEKHKCFIDVTYTLSSPFETLVGRTKYENYLSIELNKMFSCGLILSVSANNLLDTRVTTNLRTPAYSYTEKLKHRHQRFELSIRYIFGKKSIKTAQDIQDSTFDSRLKK